MQVQILGAAQGVGKSCAMVTLGNYRVMVDCGLEPSKLHDKSLLGLFPRFLSMGTGGNETQFEEDDLVGLVLHLQSVEPPDCIFITHAHVDHVGSLPFLFLFIKDRFRGKIYMTWQTRVLYERTIRDLIYHHRPKFFANTLEIADILQKYSHQDIEQVLLDYAFCETALRSTMDRIEICELNHALRLAPLICARLLSSGHMMGGCMVHLISSYGNILVSGDINMQAERLVPANDVFGLVQGPSVDVLVCESTLGRVYREKCRYERESDFVNQIRETLGNGGNVMVAALAMGRMHEIGLLLEGILAENLVSKSTKVYMSGVVAWDAYRDIISNAEQRGIDTKDIKLSRIAEMSDQVRTSLIDGVHDPCIIIGASASMQHGFIAKLAAQWATNPKNLFIMCGVNTIRAIAAQSSELNPSTHGPSCQVSQLEFSAHADAAELYQFIAYSGAKDIILVHGDPKSLEGHRASLEMQDHPYTVHVPFVGQTLSFSFANQRCEHDALMGDDDHGQQTGYRMDFESRCTILNWDMLLKGLLVLEDYTPCIFQQCISRQTIAYRSLQIHYATSLNLSLSNELPKHVSLQYMLDHCQDIFDTCSVEIKSIEWNPEEERMAESVAQIVLSL